MPKDSVSSLIDTITDNVQRAAERSANLFEGRTDVYTKGDIEEVPTGWNISIYDPEGDYVVTLHYIMTSGQRYSKHIEEDLHSQADGLLSHLNRHVYR